MDIWGAGGMRTGVGAGSLEEALPGEWVAFFLVLGALALIGAVILVIACVGHERAVVRRSVRRAQYVRRRAAERQREAAAVDVAVDGRGPANVHKYAAGSSRVATVQGRAIRK